MYNNHDLAQVALNATLCNNAQEHVQHASNNKIAYLIVAVIRPWQGLCPVCDAVRHEDGSFCLPTLATQSIVEQAGLLQSLLVT